MVMSVQEAVARLRQFQEFVQAVMVDGIDYGKIPGTEKPTLLKPGAEKLCEIYGFAPHVEVTNRVEDWTNGFFQYECKCTLVSKRTGTVVAEGIGSCNSREKRYSDRWVFGSDIPAGVDKEQLQKRTFTGKNGKEYVKYLWKNEDIYTLVNTIQKMAKKRAMIDATLSATRSSGMFTQDVEDWVEGEIREPAPKPQPAQPAPAPKAEPPTDELKALKTRWSAIWNELTTTWHVKPMTDTIPFNAGVERWREGVADLEAELGAVKAANPAKVAQGELV
jgi:hypothetical protein